MAIQLNERDYLIFKLLAEHNVLLEKHIAWFIAQEDKPVLIRDRLRKLFYLDYLLCERYDEKLPWWTTPTKPLIYKLAPLAKAMTGFKKEESEAFDIQQEQKFLEIANIRMIFLIAQNEGLLQNLQWKTALPAQNGAQLFDAFISCNSMLLNHNIGLLSHPALDETLPAKINQRLADENITSVMIVARDEHHQQSLQKLWRDNNSQFQLNKVFFTVHQDLYKSGLDKAKWFNNASERMTIFNHPAAVSPLLTNSAFTDLPAA